ncbi:hypothetical protein [Enterobacter wuhouensis]|uniref:hypothetical protein n=1 Tax=Enterobacter wuhouensis TaxID=2529381 RepID=UPI003D788189
MAAGKNKIDVDISSVAGEVSDLSLAKKFCSHHQGLNDAYFSSYFVATFHEWNFHLFGSLTQGRTSETWE